MIAFLIFAQVVLGTPTPLDLIPLTEGGGDIYFGNYIDEKDYPLMIIRSTGEIWFKHPEKLDETAKKFFEILQANWSDVCGKTK